MRMLATLVTLALGLAAAPGWAQTPAAGGFQSSDEPIEIVADELEVRQNEGLAVFSGSVDAVQGDMRLTADVLNVHYGSEGVAAGGDIERVVAVGNVVVRSLTDVARGDRGVYDVVAQQITLTGDVVLTRDENVLRGNRLDVDLVTGISTMRASDARGRVRALFTPQDGGGGS